MHVSRINCLFSVFFVPANNLVCYLHSHVFPVSAFLVYSELVDNELARYDKHYVAAHPSQVITSTTIKGGRIGRSLALHQECHEHVEEI